MTISLVREANLVIMPNLAVLYRRGWRHWSNLHVDQSRYAPTSRPSLHCLSRSSCQGCAYGGYGRASRQYYQGLRDHSSAIGRVERRIPWWTVTCCAKKRCHHNKIAMKLQLTSRTLVVVLENWKSQVGKAGSFFTWQVQATSQNVSTVLMIQFLDDFLLNSIIWPKMTIIALAVASHISGARHHLERDYHLSISSIENSTNSKPLALLA